MIDQYSSPSLSEQDSSNLDLYYRALRREMLKKNQIKTKQNCIELLVVPAVIWKNINPLQNTLTIRNQEKSFYRGRSQILFTDLSWFQKTMVYTSNICVCPLFIQIEIEISSKNRLETSLDFNSLISYRLWEFEYVLWRSCTLLFPPRIQITFRFPPESRQPSVLIK